MNTNGLGVKDAMDSHRFHKEGLSTHIFTPNQVLYAQIVHTGACPAPRLQGIKSGEI